MVAEVPKAADVSAAPPAGDFEEEAGEGCIGAADFEEDGSTVAAADDDEADEQAICDVDVRVVGSVRQVRTAVGDGGDLLDLGERFSL